MIFFILIWSLCSIALIALASAMSKHQKQIFGRELAVNHTRIATFMGWLLLILAFIICLANGQKSNMISYLIGVISFAALFVGLCLSYIQAKIKKIALMLAIISVISLLSHVL